MTARMKLVRADGRTYLERWGWECRLFGVFVHRMDAPDPGMDLHDHPFWFTSFILWGGYTEERCHTDRAARVARYMEADGHTERGVPRVRRWLSWQSTPMNRCHRIVGLRRSTSWSLVLHGPKRRTWGFYLPTGWVDWRTYEHTVRAERRDMWAEISNGDRPKTRYARGRGQQ